MTSLEFYLRDKLHFESEDHTLKELLNYLLGKGYIPNYEKNITSEDAVYIKSENGVGKITRTIPYITYINEIEENGRIISSKTTIDELTNNITIDKSIKEQHLSYNYSTLFKSGLIVEHQLFEKDLILKGLNELQHEISKEHLLVKMTHRELDKKVRILLNNELIQKEKTVKQP